jgi:NAD(P) transhydrogenase subunit alpha
MPLKLKSWLLAAALIAALATNAFAQKAPDASSPAKPTGSHQSSVEKVPVGKAEAPVNQAAEKAGSLDLMSMVFVFMLATFIGIGVIMRVSRLLHTPLMSLTNAISAIAVVGSIIVTGGQHPWWITLLGGVALFASMTNIVSGFLITDRMLKMFKKREPNKS